MVKHGSSPGRLLKNPQVVLCPLPASSDPDQATLTYVLGAGECGGVEGGSVNHVNHVNHRRGGAHEAKPGRE